MFSLFLRIVLLISLVPISVHAMNSETAPTLKKRRSVLSACDACRRDHAACDEVKPCRRCNAKGIGDFCIEKSRNRKKFKKSNSPKIFVKTKAKLTGIFGKGRKAQQHDDEFGDDNDITDIPCRTRAGDNKSVAMSPHGESAFRGPVVDDSFLDQMRNPVCVLPSAPGLLPDSVTLTPSFSGVMALETPPCIHNLYDTTADEAEMTWDEIVGSMKEMDEYFYSEDGKSVPIAGGNGN